MRRKIFVSLVLILLTVFCFVSCDAEQIDENDVSAALAHLFNSISADDKIQVKIKDDCELADEDLSNFVSEIEAQAMTRYGENCRFQGTLTFTAIRGLSDSSKLRLEFILDGQMDVYYASNHYEKNKVVLEGEMTLVSAGSGKPWVMKEVTVTKATSDKYRINASVVEDKLVFQFDNPRDVQF